MAGGVFESGETHLMKLARARLGSDWTSTERAKMSSWPFHEILVHFFFVNLVFVLIFHLG